MLSQKISRRLFHGRDIQFTPQSVYVFSLKYTLPIRCFHVIRIRFPYSGKTAVEPLRCLLRIYDPYILRQIPVHILHGRCCRRTELLLNMEIGRLPPGMDPASVRPEPWTSTSCPVHLKSTASSFPWIVLSVFPCFCQPSYLEPSYSSISDVLFMIVSLLVLPGIILLYQFSIQIGIPGTKYSACQYDIISDLL